MHADLDSIVEDAMVAGQAEKAAAATTAATPANQPEKTEPEKPADATDKDGSPAPKADDAEKQDEGAPKPTEDDPEPTPAAEDEDALAEAYRLADIDPKDPKAASKLTEHLRSAKTAPKEPEPKPAKEEAPEPTTDLGKVLAEYINTDQTCLQFATEHKQAEATVKSLGEQIKATNETIGKLELRLNPPKIEGVEDLEMDELLQVDLQRKLDKAYRDYDNQKRKFDGAWEKAKDLAGKWRERVDKHAEGLVSKQQEKEQAREEEAAHVAATAKYRTEFDAAFDAEFAKSGIPKEEKSRTCENVMLRTHNQIDKWARDGKLDTIDDPKAHFAGLIKQEKEAYERHHVLRSKGYAEEKRAAVTAGAPDAPPSKAHQPGGQEPKRYADVHEAREDILDRARAR